MALLPESVRDAWEHRDGPVVLTSMDSAGVPNAIYASCVSMFGDDKLVVADNYFSKTRANILADSKAAILFITADSKAFQVKGTLEYQTKGEIFDDMKQWLDPKHPGHAAVVLHVEEVYSGADQLA
ncbi:MAG: pyridoxamine 5'-phosphate oxidase family protein [Lentisphaeria bacterium]|nr:pyridoxamine 5'-phosphate oxidase family protein [Lentisphaeria bacterium]